MDAFIVPLLRDRIGGLIGAHLPPAGSVLDVGCGRQPFRALLEGPNTKYVGMDVAQTPEGTVDVVAAVDAPLPQSVLDRGPFDFVLCTEVLEHVADWAAAFANLAALTRPGGRILITCPHFYRLHEEPYDFWRPTPHAIKHFSHANGLSVVHQETAGDGWDVLGTVLGSCIAIPRAPGVLPRVGAKIVHVANRLAFRILRTGVLQRLARFPGVYLSNVVVLERR